MKYISVPVEVDAFQIRSVFPRGENGMTRLTLENGHTVEASAPMTERYMPSVDDYYILRKDASHFLMPREVFEKAYRVKEAMLDDGALT